jgi:hypothetical protein
MLVSGYLDVQNAMTAILLEANEIVVEPFELGFHGPPPRKTARSQTRGRTELNNRE